MIGCMECPQRDMDIVGSLSFVSDTGNVYGPYGTMGSQEFNVNATEIIAFFGRSGSHLDAIGIYYN